MPKESKVEKREEKMKRKKGLKNSKKKSGKCRKNSMKCRETLAPVIGEVPVLRSVLPSDLQRKTPAELQAEADAKAQAEADLKDYVDTYSAMKASDAAAVFDSMMPDQEDLIVRILSNMTPDQRAAILSKMAITNAADLTTKMEQ